MESVGALLPFALILVAFYFLIVRPARNRQRAASQLQDALRVGQQVMMTSGLYGTITAIDDDAVMLETSPGVTQRWAKPAVAKVVTPVDDVDATPDTLEQDSGTPENPEHRPEP